MKRLFVFTVVVVAGVAAAVGQATTAHSVDLASATIDGHRVLGRTVAGVTAVLGRPDFRAGNQQRYRVGRDEPTDFSLEVLFRRSGGTLRAWSVVFERGAVRDPKLGDLLARLPVSLQAAIRSRYADRYRLLRGYHCRANGDCVGEFAQPSGSLRLSFGTEPAHGRWLTLWTN